MTDFIKGAIITVPIIILYLSIFKKLRLNWDIVESSTLAFLFTAIIITVLIALFIITMKIGASF